MDLESLSLEDLSKEIKNRNESLRSIFNEELSKSGNPLTEKGEKLVAAVCNLDLCQSMIERIISDKALLFEKLASIDPSLYE
jgi:hypothetical protein